MTTQATTAEPESESELNLTHSDDATIVETAVALHCELLRRTAGGPQIEADTYRGESIDYELKAAINGWQAWTDDTATQFVKDCLEAASADLENQWYKAFRAIGADTGVDR